MDQNEIVYLHLKLLYEVRYKTCTFYIQDLDMIVFFTENGKLKHYGTYKASGYGIPEEAGELIPGLENTVFKCS